MRNSTRLEILGFDPDSDLHRGRSSVVDRGFEVEEVAHIDWMVEVHAVDACCNHNGSGVSQGRNPSCNIDKFEDCAAVDVSHRFGVYMHHLTGKGGLGSGYRLCQLAQAVYGKSVI